MTGVEAGLAAQLVLGGVAVLVAALAPDRRRRQLSGVASGALAAAGLVTGLAALGGATGRLALPTTLGPLPATFAPDRLGGLFMVVVAGVGILVAVYGVGYAHGAASSRTAWSALALFLLGMQLVPAAADLVSFLLAWELMAVASTVLLLADHQQRSEVRSAAVWYSVMTQLSFLMLVAGFSVLAASGGGTTFAAMATNDPSSFGAGVAFVLLILGFAGKAGIVPLHVWLPRAHPEAPSHVSAAMSAAMVKLGVYGALVVTLRLLPGGPAWWGITLLVLGGVSAVYGILQASVSSDVKRLLAYSTTENVGLMFLALGAAMLFRTSGADGARRRRTRRLPAARGEPCRVQGDVVPRRRSGAPRHRPARPRPARRARGPNALDRCGVRGRGAGGCGASGHVGLRRRVDPPSVTGPRRAAGRPARGRRDARCGLGDRAHRRAGPAHLRQGVRHRLPRPTSQ